MAEIEYLTVKHLPTKDLIRIFSKISIDPAILFNGTPCWNWQASRENKGYGIYWFHKHVKAHRFMYAWLVHELPIGQKHGEIDHLCLNKSCCNPSHLEFVSSVVNARRKAALQTRCKHGHPFSFENTHFNKNGHRICLTCRKIKSQRDWNNLTAEQRLAKNTKMRKWRSKNRDHVNEQQRGYVIKNQKQRRAYSHQYYTDNQQAVLVKAAAYRTANREQINERQRRWRAEHPEEYKEQTRRNNAKRYS